MDVELRCPSTVVQPDGAGITTLARFRVEDGRPGVEAEELVSPGWPPEA
jgi:hypothetical protein